MRKPVNSKNSPEHNCIINNRKITITFVMRTVHVRVAKLAVEWGWGAVYSSARSTPIPSRTDIDVYSRETIGGKRGRAYNSFKTITVCAF